MKYTLLEIIQRVLSSIKGEEVDNFNDTAESLVIRDIIKECYYTIVSNQDFPELKTLFELETEEDDTKPTLMTLPADAIGLEWVKYKSDDAFFYVRYLPVKEFLELNHMLDENEANVGTFTVTTGAEDAIEFYYRNDKAPQFYTSFDDNTVVFDSYDVSVEDYLQKDKTLCYGLKATTWDDSNNFTLPLDAQQFNILLKDAKAMAWEELRQTTNNSAVAQARKAKISAEKKKDRVNYNHKSYYQTNYPNYGRK